MRLIAPSRPNSLDARWAALGRAVLAQADVSRDPDPAEGDVCEVRLERGTIHDFAALAPFHYRGGVPATWCRVLRAVDRDNDELAGVLVASMPTLNGRHRAHAWPELFPPGLSKRESADRLNAKVRTISRVVVDPRYRSMGVGVALVRAYLAEPCTTHTETIAAMGRWQPFFERAGMRVVEVPPRAKDEALSACLRSLGVEAAGLIERRCWESPGVAAALARWGASGRGNRGLDVGSLALRAAAAIVSPPRVLVTP